MLRPLLALPLIAAAAPSVLVGQKPIHEYFGQDYDRMGASVAKLGDVDRDGFPDFLIGAVQSVSSGSGAATIVSGRTGRHLHRFVGQAQRERFGCAVAVLNADGDGVPDYAIGAFQRRDNLGGGGIDIYSGKTRRLLRRIVIPGSTRVANFGKQLVAPGDFNKDRIDDLVVAAHDRLYGISVKDGKKLWEVRFGQISGERGTVLALGADWDQDGIRDVVVGDPTGAEQVATVSSANGSISIVQRIRGTQFGQVVALLDDIDGDGVQDFAASTRHYRDPQRDVDVGLVVLYSGKTQREIRRIQGRPGAWIGYGMASVDDLDGDKRRISRFGFARSARIASSSFRLRQAANSAAFRPTGCRATSTPARCSRSTMSMAMASATYCSRMRPGSTKGSRPEAQRSGSRGSGPSRKCWRTTAACGRTRLRCEVSALASVEP